MSKVSLKNHFLKLKKQFEIVQQIPEVNKLKANQVRLIKISLYLNLRYNRYLKNKWPTKIKPKKTDPYYYTAMFFIEWFCHASARAIQLAKFDEKLLIKTPAEYFHGDSTSTAINSVKDINLYLPFKPAPRIVHLAKMIEGKLAPMHTIIYLGKHPDLGDIFFEKEAAFEFFKLTNTATIIDYYPGFHWIFREITCLV